jgi:hypothetical protein
MRIFTLLRVSLSCLPLSIIAQRSTSLTTSQHTFEHANCVLKDGTASTEWFIGTTRDFLVIQMGGVSKRLARRDLVGLNFSDVQTGRRLVSCREVDDELVC